MKNDKSKNIDKGAAILASSREAGAHLCRAFVLARSEKPSAAYKELQAFATSESADEIMHGIASAILGEASDDDDQLDDGFGGDPDLDLDPDLDDPDKDKNLEGDDDPDADSTPVPETVARLSGFVII